MLWYNLEPFSIFYTCLTACRSELYADDYYDLYATVRVNVNRNPLRALLYGIFSNYGYRQSV